MKVKVPEVVDNNKLNIITVTKADSKHPTTFLILAKHEEVTLYESITHPFKKHELKLDEELNL